MTIPKEWRGVRIGTVLIRLRGGKAILSSFTATKATVTFRGNFNVTMTHEELYRRYRPA
jgi:hypothetical protein